MMQIHDVTEENSASFNCGIMLSNCHYSLFQLRAIQASKAHVPLADTSATKKKASYVSNKRSRGQSPEFAMVPFPPLLFEIVCSPANRLCGTGRD